VIDPLLAADPDIVYLERRFNELHTKIKWEYMFIKRAPKKKRIEHKPGRSNEAEEINVEVLKLR
jgi:hypothetical protein